MEENDIVWGIIGCGDVAEVKSGPAFQKCSNSRLQGVMRRNESLAKDFAKRHHVPVWYKNADELIDNSDINAVYIATPPSTHLKYALAVLKAGKHVYVEKPMTLSKKEALQLERAERNSNGKLVVAHYRRFLPLYIKVKELIDSMAIGTIKFVDLKFLQPFDFNTKETWRLNKAVSGGGYFHDLAPHQLDLMYYIFGEIERAGGIAVNQSKNTSVEDIINGIISFENGIQFRGIWSFSVPEFIQEDTCVIYGEKGKIEFSFYKDQLKLSSKGEVTEVFNFTNPENIQQPMIQETVNYFLGLRNNPCPVEDGVLVIELMEEFTKQ